LAVADKSAHHISAEGLAALDFGFASSTCFRDQPVL
jgi:hypothetical protein